MQIATDRRDETAASESLKEGALTPEQPVNTRELDGVAPSAIHHKGSQVPLALPVTAGSEEHDGTKNQSDRRHFIAKHIGVGGSLAASVGFFLIVIADYTGPELVELFETHSYNLAIGTLFVSAIIYGVANLLWRAEQLRLRSSALEAATHRIMQPSLHAEQSVATLGAAVTSHVSAMDHALDQALEKAKEIVGTVELEVNTINRSHSDNIFRVNAAVRDMAQERSALESTTVGMANTLKAANADIPRLIETLEHRQSALDQSLLSLGEHVEKFSSSVDDKIRLIESSMEKQTSRLEGVISEESDRLDNVLSGFTEDIGASLHRRSFEVQSLLQAHLDLMSEALTRGASMMDSAIMERSSELIQTLADHAQEFAAATEMQISTLEASMESRETALAEVLRQENRTLADSFDDNVAALCGTIASGVTLLNELSDKGTLELSDKLNQLSAALSDILQTQAASIENAITQGAYDIKNTTSDFLRTSESSVDKMLGQADLLKNISETVLAQIEGTRERLADQAIGIVSTAESFDQLSAQIGHRLESHEKFLDHAVYAVSHHTTRLDQALGTYTDTLHSSLAEAESRASGLALELSRNWRHHFESAVQELSSLRVTMDDYAKNSVDLISARFENLSVEIARAAAQLRNDAGGLPDEIRMAKFEILAALRAEHQSLSNEIRSLPPVAQPAADILSSAIQRRIDGLHEATGIPVEKSMAHDVEETPELDHRIRALHEAAAALGQKLQRRPSAGPAEHGSNSWSIKSLLSGASLETDSTRAMSGEQFPAMLHAAAGAIDPEQAIEAWRRLRSRTSPVFGSYLYGREGWKQLETLRRHYQFDDRFSSEVDAFLGQFENKLRSLEASDRSGKLVNSEIASDRGRAYIVLAHAADRLKAA